MHSHSFQDTKFKLLIQVKDFQEQVVEGLSILRYPGGLRIKGHAVTQKRKFYVHSHSFQNTELKLHRYVSDSPGQVVERLTMTYDDSTVPQRGQE